MTLGFFFFLIPSLVSVVLLTCIFSQLYCTLSWFKYISQTAWTEVRPLPIPSCWCSLETQKMQEQLYMP